MQRFLGRGPLADGLSGIIAKLVYTAFTLATTIVLAREFGPEGYGTYAYAFSLVVFLTLPAQAGMPVLMMREVAAYQARDRQAQLNGLIRRCTQFVVCLSFIGVIGYLLVGILSIPRFQPEYAGVFLVAAPLVPLITYSNFLAGTLRGFRRMQLGLLPELVIRPGGFVLLSLAMIATEHGNRLFSPVSAMALHVLAATFAASFAAIALNRVHNRSADRSDFAYETRRWIRSLLPLSMLAGLSVVNTQADVLMLAWFVRPEEVGHYRIAVQGAGLAAIGLVSFNMILGPHFARLNALGDQVGLQRIVGRATIAYFLLTVLFAAVLTLVGEPLLALAFGEAFRPAYGMLVVISWAQVVNASMGSVRLLLNMTGYEAIALRWMSAAAMLNVGLNIVLIPRMAGMGAAAATLLTIVFWNVALAIEIRRRLGIHSSVFVALRAVPR